MLYKITGTKNWHISEIICMLRECRGTLKAIKINKKVDGKLKHHVNYKPQFKEDGGEVLNYSEMLRTHNMWALSQKETIIRYIVVEADNILTEKWNDVGCAVICID